MTAADARFVTEFIDSLFPVRPDGPMFDAFVSNARLHAVYQGGPERPPRCRSRPDGRCQD